MPCDDINPKVTTACRESVIGRLLTLIVPPNRLGKEADCAVLVSSSSLKCVGLKTENNPKRCDGL